MQPGPSPAVQELLDRSGQLITERADLAARIKVIDADVATLRRAVEILNGQVSEPTAPPRTKPRDKPGNLTSVMLDVLREAGTPLTAAEVGRMAMERTGQDADAFPRSVITSRATTALKKYSDRGTVLRLDGGDGPIRWAVPG